MKHIKVYNTDNEITGIDYFPNLSVVRNGEKTSGSGDYIRNGLIFLFDGLNKGTDDLGWTELVTQKLFYSSNAIKQNDNYTTGSSKYLYNDETVSMPAASCTIEVCYDSLGTNNGVIFAGKGSNQIAFGISGTGNDIVWSTGSTPKYTTPIAYRFTGVHTISVNADNCIADINEPVKISSSNASVASNSSYNLIGGSGSNAATNTFAGKIYAIRVYNRKLSVAEMKHNQQEDIKRYGITGMTSLNDYESIIVNTVVDGYNLNDPDVPGGYIFTNGKRLVLNLMTDLTANKVLLHWEGGTTIPKDTWCVFDEDIYLFYWKNPFDLVSGKSYMLYFSERLEDNTNAEVLKIAPYQMYRTSN